MCPRPRQPDPLRAPPRKAEAAREKQGPRRPRRARAGMGARRLSSHTKGRCGLRLGCGSRRGPGCSATEATGSPGEKGACSGRVREHPSQERGTAWPRGPGPWSLLTVPALRRRIRISSAWLPAAPTPRVSETTGSETRSPFLGPTEGGTANPPAPQAACLHLFRGGKNTDRPLDGCPDHV